MYQQFCYSDALPDRCRGDLLFTAERTGRLNAVRFITKNLLVLTCNPPESVDWMMNYLIVPLQQPADVRAGDTVRVTFDYRPGEEISALTDTLRLKEGTPINA